MTLTKDMRLLLADGQIMRILSVGYSDQHKMDVVALCGTRTYKESRSRGLTSLSKLNSKIKSGQVKIVTTKLGQSEVDLGTGISNYKPELVDTIIDHAQL